MTVKIFSNIFCFFLVNFFFRLLKVNYGAQTIIIIANFCILKLYNELNLKMISINFITTHFYKLYFYFRLLEVNYGVQTIIIIANLENFDDEMYKKFNNLSLEIDLGILINNAGLHYHYPQLFNQVINILLTKKKNCE